MSLTGKPLTDLVLKADLPDDGDLLYLVDLQEPIAVDRSKAITWAAFKTALDTRYVFKSAATGGARLPAGTTAQRPAGPVVGDVRYNTTLDQYEGFDGTNWGALGGGATGAPGNAVFHENDQTVTADYTLTAGKNAMSAGPITVATGVTVTVPTGATWTVV